MKSPIIPLSRSEEEKQSGSEARSDCHFAHNFVLSEIHIKQRMACRILMLSKPPLFYSLVFICSATRMSSTRQKINLCKSRNPKLSRNSDSPEFLLLCTTSYSNLIDARRKKPVMIWYFPVAMLPTFFLTSLHLYEVCNNIVKHRVVKVFPREYTIAYFC